MQKFCDVCGGVASVSDMVIRHDPNCPNHADAIDDTPVEPIRTTDGGMQGGTVKSLALARAQKGATPEMSPAMQALDIARDWVRESGIEPAHVIVFIAREYEEGADGIKYFQTGSYRPHAQVGMVIEGLDILRGSGWTEYGK